MAWFRFEYKDPETGEPVTVEREVLPTGDFTARQWAEDLGYSLADKGPCKITEIKVRS